MQEKNTEVMQELAEIAEKQARMEELRKAGCLTRELANMPDGGASVLGWENMEKLKEYATYRAKLPRR